MIGNLLGNAVRFTDRRPHRAAPAAGPHRGARHRHRHDAGSADRRPSTRSIAPIPRARKAAAWGCRSCAAWASASAGRSRCAASPGEGTTCDHPLRSASCVGLERSDNGMTAAVGRQRQARCRALCARTSACLRPHDRQPACLPSARMPRGHDASSSLRSYWPSLAAASGAGSNAAVDDAASGVPHGQGRARRHPRRDFRHRHAERDLHRRGRQPDFRPGHRSAGRLQRPRDRPGR